MHSHARVLQLLGMVRKEKPTLKQKIRQALKEALAKQGKTKKPVVARMSIGSHRAPYCLSLSFAVLFLPP